MAGVTEGYYKGSIWMKDKKGFQISVNPNHYHLMKKTLVLKGSRRPRMKKGLKSIPQQAKDFANIRGSDKEVPSKISTWTLIILSVMIMMVPMKNTLRKAGMDAGRETNSDTEKYFPSKRTLSVDKASTALKKVIQSEYRSRKMKNKRVISNKQDIKKQEAINLLDNDIGDKDSSDIYNCMTII